MHEKIIKSFDQTFTDLYDEEEFNGVVLIAKKGKILYKKAFGIANIKTEDKLGTTSIFNLASLSKQFTAMCIMILQEQGSLDYDDPINKYLNLPYKNITIRHLLHHTSGLPAYEDAVEKYWKGDRETDFVSHQDLLEMYMENKLKLLFEPNQKYEYSNTGYVFLASIVEKVSKMSFEDFIQEHIFDPLEMKNSFANKRPKKMPKKIAQGFTTDDNDEYLDYSYNYFDGVVGDGNVFSSAEDLAIYDHALNQNKLVSEKTLQEAFTSAVLENGEETEYGFGWSVDSASFVWHDGCWEAYNTYLGRDLEQNLAFIVLSNNDYDFADDLEEIFGEFYD